MPMGDGTARNFAQDATHDVALSRLPRAHRGLAAGAVASSLELLPHETRSKKPEKGFKSKLPRPKPDLDFQGKTERRLVVDI